MEQTFTSEILKKCFDEAQMAAINFIIENQSFNHIQLIMFSEFIIHNVLNQPSAEKEFLERFDEGFRMHLQSKYDKGNFSEIKI